MNRAEKQESLARFLNQISQTDIHFDNCSKKIQEIYRYKADSILKHLEEIEATK